MFPSPIPTYHTCHQKPNPSRETVSLMLLADNLMLTRRVLLLIVSLIWIRIPLLLRIEILLQKCRQ